MLEGLNTWPLRNRITYFVSSPGDADGGEQIPPVAWSSSRAFSVPITRNSNAVLVAVWNALAGQTNIEVRRYVRRDLDRPADQQRDEDLGDGHPEARATRCR